MTDPFYSRLLRTLNLVDDLGFKGARILIRLAQEGVAVSRSDLMVSFGQNIDLPLHTLQSMGLVERVAYIDAPGAADYRITQAGRDELERIRRLWHSER